MIDDQEIRALAFLARRRRPHGAPRWDEPGIIAAIEKVRHLALGEVQDALGRAADDRAALTPAVITNLTSSYWRADVAGLPVAVERVAAAELCDVCGQAQHPDTDHKYLPVGEYLARRQLPDPERHTAAAMKQLASCETTTEETA